MTPDLPISSLGFLEELYARFLENPQLVSDDWRSYFEAQTNGNGADHDFRIGPSFRARSLFDTGAPAPITAASGPAADLAGERSLQHRVDQLVRAYRVRGHMIARLDPLGLPRPHLAELSPVFYALHKADLGRPVSPHTLYGLKDATVNGVLRQLQNTYCRSIGVEYMHIDDLIERSWLQERMESSENRLALPRATQVRILTRLTDAVLLEEFIQKSYVGAKSFSLEGSESLIPLLDLAIEGAAAQGVREIVVGMAHRGRLNVLANVIGKSLRRIFREFEDREDLAGKGDVKYHLGHSSDWKTTSGDNVHLSLCFNPSHLELVGPVVLGRVRAKQDRFGDSRREQALPLVIHGDAAFAGEGVVQEMLNLSQLAAYRVGGTIHVVVNNQIGFTTSPAEARSSVYATSVAKMLQIPILHVNGEDPEAVAQTIALALDFRKTFGRDAVIDMYGYRRRGHNEGDEPSFTQPLLYRAIERRKNVREGYLEHLLSLGGVSRAEADRIAAERQAHLEKELQVARSEEAIAGDVPLKGIWDGRRGGPARAADAPETAVPAERLARLLQRLTEVPDDFHLHKKLGRLLETRREMASLRRPLDWSAGEALALATLSEDGRRIRLTGQDSGRGTFSHRHGVLYDTEDGHPHVPIADLRPGQGPVEIANSPLSELAPLAYEYGYSLDCPDGLVMWEAQFGDFVNMAQPIIDQFIASAEDKWRRLSRLVLLLPHGFEGMGPEHSSARLERFLQLAADDNIQVAQPTTPAQIFHLLRRQTLRQWVKPLVVLTPKSLLRHPAVVSPIERLASGGFCEVLGEDDGPPPKAVKSVLLCSGKIYYELAERRKTLQRSNVAILRLEQLYPLRQDLLEAELARYPGAKTVGFVQDEPENMGAWRFLQSATGGAIAGRELVGHTRPESATTATGSGNTHKREQRELLARAIPE